MRLTLGKKLGISFGVILALAVLGSTISYFKLSGLTQSMDATFGLRIPSTEAGMALQRDMNMTSVKARQAILAGSQPDRREIARKALGENVGSGREGSRHDGRTGPQMGASGKSGRPG